MAETIALEEQPLLQSASDKAIDDSLELVQPLPASKSHILERRAWLLVK